MAQAGVGAGDRLAPALQKARERASERLQPKLVKANTTTYLRQMRGHAKAFGQPLPKAITDKAVIASIAARAKVSAESIVNTQADRMRALVALQGSVAAAQQPFKTWEKGQLERIADFESGMTVNAAVSDFQANNADTLTGTEHAEPRDGICDECNDAIDQGDVPIGDLPDFPLHLNCVHYSVVSYEAPEDASALWFGA